MKKLTIILSFIVVGINAQQYSLPTQIDRNLLYVNSAYAGSLEAAVISVFHRSQWVGMPGALSFQSFEIHAPLKKQAVAIGLQARHESIGSKDNSELFFTYAHRVRFEKSTLAFALKAGGHSIRFGESKLENELDAAFTSTSTILPNVGFGVSFYGQKYFFGVSVPYFFGEIINEQGVSQIDFNASRLAYIATAGGSIKLSKFLKLEPVAAFFYSTTLKPQASALVNFMWFDSFILGAGYRLSEGILFNAGYNISQQFSFAYSYDYNIGQIGAYSNGSHEIGLLYYFGYKVVTTNPRDF